MKTEHDSATSPPEGQAWLDGLAGRGGSSEAAADGARMRESLNVTDAESAPSAMPPWDDIVAAAGRTVVPIPPPTGQEAANEWQWKRVAVGAVAALVIGMGLWTMKSPPNADPGGMRGTPSNTGPVWRTANPQQAAGELAKRLEGAGARVVLVRQNDGTLLTIESDASASKAVNELLAPLEAAVDGNGRLALRVLPLK